MTDMTPYVEVQSEDSAKRFRERTNQDPSLIVEHFDDEFRSSLLGYSTSVTAELDSDRQLLIDIQTEQELDVGDAYEGTSHPVRMLRLTFSPAAWAAFKAFGDATFNEDT